MMLDTGFLDSVSSIRQCLAIVDFTFPINCHLVNFFVNWGDKNHATCQAFYHQSGPSLGI